MTERLTFAEALIMSRTSLSLVTQFLINMRKIHPFYSLLTLLLLLVFANSRVHAAPATVGAFTGGDVGEGLDLEGTFIYAFTVGPETEDPGQAGDAFFTTDQIPGVVVTAVNSIASWLSPTYADTDADVTLAKVMKSIRWSPDPAKPQIELQGLSVGARYKLQLLFAESCCPNRGFDIYIDGALAVDEFIPASVQLENDGTLVSVGAVVTYEFIAARPSITVLLNGSTATSPTISDHNPIINGVTLEQLEAPGDTDNDGLADAWEQLYFGNLTQTGAEDPDHDGLSNAEELLAGTDPTKADTDGDGLSDGSEVKTLGTNPKSADTDGDGLSDSDEISIYHTDPKLADTDGDGLDDKLEIAVSHSDPLKMDTDGDGVNDLTEYYSRSNPSDKLVFPRQVTVGRFFGGDAGEGLDLDGTIPYAFSVGTDAAAAGQQVRDANFTLDSEPGITVTAGHEIPNWHAPNYGDTANDLALATVMRSIRWAEAATASPALNVDLDNLEVGKRYKLQLLFAEQCCAGRGFDVFVRPGVPETPFTPFDLLTDRMLVHDFGPAAVQGGAGYTKAGAYIAYEFTAQDTILHVVLDGRTATSKFADHNAILNGVVLKVVDVGPDTDGDGLPDAWEIANFGNLAQTAAGDPDGDGLTNLQEYQLSLDPKNADTDRDGLSDGKELTQYHTDPANQDSDSDGLRDGAEVSTYGTDPALTDSDGDGLADGDEVLTYHTNPAIADTDGDGVSDGAEVVFGLNPLVPDAPTISDVVIQAFTGGDVDEGLDLDGEFVYAINVGPDGAAGKARDAEFTADNAPGVIMQAGASITASGWFPAAFGDTENDQVLNKVMGSIRHSPPVRLTFTGLSVGASYKLQLLFAEQCCNRGFDVLVDGRMVADDFAPFDVQGGKGNTSQGAVISLSFLAQRDRVVVSLDGNNVANPDFTDHNPILNGATLEITEHALKIGQVNLATPTSVGIVFASSPGTSYALQYRASLSAGAWEDVPGSVLATGLTTTLTDSSSAHRNVGQGYWRVVKK